jgi:hypothetical protein
LQLCLGSFQLLIGLPQFVRSLSARNLQGAARYGVGAITFGADFVVWFHKMPYFAPHIVGGKASLR